MSSINSSGSVGDPGRIPSSGSIESTGATQVIKGIFEGHPMPEKSEIEKAISPASKLAFYRAWSDQLLGGG